MKKVLLFSMLFASMCYGVSAQETDRNKSPKGTAMPLPYHEGFNVPVGEGEFPPSGWTSFNRAKTHPVLWSDVKTTTYPLDPQEGSNCAHYCWDMMIPSFAYAQDAWLVSPAISIPAGGGEIELSFWSYINFYDDYNLGKNSVLISTVDATDTKNFEEVWFLPQGEQKAAWVKDSVSLDAYKGKDIYVAFRYYSGGGTESNWAHQWLLDNVNIVDKTKTGLENTQGAEKKFDFVVDSSDGDVDILLSTEVAVEVYDMTGSRVDAKRDGLRIRFSGQKGIYILVADCDGKQHVRKFAVR